MHVMRSLSVLVVLAVSLTGCAFFNTYFNARKAYNQAEDQIRKSVRDAQKRSAASKLSLYRFDPEPELIPDAIRQQFDIVVDKTSKVVALHPDSRWVDDAILLMGKALYYRGDLLDARNRFEVFMYQYPDDDKFPEARFWYARTLIKLGLVADAMQHLQAVREETNDERLKARCDILRGDAMMTEHFYERAARFYSDALQHRIDQSMRQDALFKRAYTYYSNNRYRDATASLKELAGTSLDAEEYFDVALMMSRALKEMGEYEEALKTVNRLLSDFRYRSYFSAAELEAADILRRKGDVELAAQQFNQLIATSKNPQYNGAAYYFLGVMHDDGGPFTDLVKAQKYYQLVATRYTQSEFVNEARNRFSYLQNMAFLRGSIDADRALLAAIDERLATGRVMQSRFDVANDSAGSELELELDEETLRELAVQDSLLKAGGTFDVDALEKEDERSEAFDQAAQGFSGALDGFTNVGESATVAKAADELASVNIDNKPLLEKIADHRKDMELLATLDNRDSLQQFRARVYLRIADDYLMLADHYQHNLGMLDSAQVYCEWITREYAGTSREERALYSIAGIYQERRSAAWKEILEDTYRRFPDGEFASMARKLLGEDNPIASTETSLQEVERQMIDGHVNGRAVEILERIAAEDTAQFKARALYNLGVIHERFRHEPQRAFGYYYALTLVNPESHLARHVKAKVDAFLSENQMDKNDAARLVDSRFYQNVENTLLIADTLQTSIDSLPVEPKDTIAVGDSTSKKRPLKRSEDDEEVRNAKVDRKGQKIKEKEAIRRDEIDE